MVGYRRYQKLAGEIEARDTENRADLRAEQRKEIAPDLRSDAIVVFGGKEYAYSSDSIAANTNAARLQWKKLSGKKLMY